MKKVRKDVCSFLEDFLSAHQQSIVVYKYSCHCDNVSIKNIPTNTQRTFQQLEERIWQHVSRSIRNQIYLRKDLPKRQCKCS